MASLWAEETLLIHSWVLLLISIFTNDGAFVGGDKHIVTDETYNVVHWSKHLVFVFLEGISLSMLHM